MTHGTLVPVDGSPSAHAALRYACRLLPDTPMTLLHVIDVDKEWDEVPGTEGGWEERARQEADAILEEAAAIARDRDVDVATRIEWGVPYREIIRIADEPEVEHIVMGGTGETVTGKFLLGSVAETVVSRASVPVTLVRFRGDRGVDAPERMLIPVDGSAEAFDSLDYALELMPDAEHVALCVCEFDIDIDEDVTGTYLAERVDRETAGAEDILARAADRAATRGIDLETGFRFGRPIHVIVEYVTDEGIDHVVVGHRGQSGIRRLMMGSVSDAVARRAPVPVTVYR